jgi:hypothetical protein
VIAIEIVVAMAFVLAAAVSITGSAWLLALGFAAHGSRTLGSNAASSSPAPVVASILRRRRLGRRFRHRDSDRRRHSLPPIAVVSLRSLVTVPSPHCF